MGKMKELFIEQQNEMEANNTFYKGVHDSMIHSLARKAIEEYIQEGEWVSFRHQSNKSRA